MRLEGGTPNLRFPASRLLENGFEKEAERCLREAKSVKAGGNVFESLTICLQRRECFVNEILRNAEMS